jgi:hypothetical protein
MRVTVAPEDRSVGPRGVYIDSIHVQDRQTQRQPELSKPAPTQVADSLLQHEHRTATRILHTHALSTRTPPEPSPARRARCEWSTRTRPASARPQRRFWQPAHGRHTRPPLPRRRPSKQPSTAAPEPRRLLRRSPRAARVPPSRPPYLLTVPSMLPTCGGQGGHMKMVRRRPAQQAGRRTSGAATTTRSGRDAVCDAGSRRAGAGLDGDDVARLPSERRRR